MPKVTNLEYWMEDELKIMLDLIADKIENKHQALIIIDGGTGTGKTNMAKGICYYLADKLKRNYNLDKVFFYGKDLFPVAQSTSKGIYHWDEGALGGKAIDWRDKDQQKLLTLLEIGRRNNHVIVLCLPRFYKLQEGIIDHASCLINTYERKSKKGNQRGHFSAYYKSAMLKLYEDWNRQKLKNYQKHESFHGTFPNLTDKIYSEDDYDKRKLDAIMNFDKKQEKEVLQVNEDREKLWALRKAIATIEFPVLNKTDLAKKLQLDRKRIVEWADRRASTIGLTYLGVDGDIQKENNEAQSDVIDSNDTIIVPMPISN